MKFVMLWPAVCLLLTMGIQAQDGDCSFETTGDAGLILYYYSIPNLTLTADEGPFMQRCTDQLNSADILLCYANRCLKERGLELFRRIIRAAQYEVLHLCHPHADPDKKSAFKSLLDCHNAIYPKLHACAIEYQWHLASVVTGSGVDVQRFCCALHQADECLTAACQECVPEARRHFEEIAHAYQGDAMSFMCSGTSFHNDPNSCSDMSPAEKTNQLPQLEFASFDKIARAL